MYGTKVILIFVSLSGILGFLTPTSFAHIHGYLGPFRTTTKPPTTLQAKVRSVAGAGETCLDYGNCKPGLICCNVGDGNKCWECCEDVHCDALGKICWYSF